MQTIHIILMIIVTLAIFAGVAVTILYAAKKRRAAEYHKRHPVSAGNGNHAGHGHDDHGHGHGDHGPDVEQIRKEAAETARGRGIGKFFILITLVILGAILLRTNAPAWTLALLGFIAVYFVVDAVFGPVNKWVNVVFLILGILLITSIFRGWPMDLTHFQNRVSTKQSEEEVSSDAVTPSRQLPGVAMMTITPYGSFYTNLVPGVVYNVPDVINSKELICKFGETELSFGPKNPFVVQGVSSEKPSGYFTKELCRLKDSVDTTELLVPLVPIRWEDTQ